MATKTKKASPFAAKLAKLKKGWTTARKEAEETPQGGDFKQLADGRYKGQVSDGEVNQSKNSGRLQAFLEFTVVEGDQAGETQRKYWGLEKPEHLVYFHRDLMRLGYEVPEDPAELEATIKEIVKDKPVVLFRNKTNVNNPDFINTYIDKVLEEEGAAEAEEEQAAEAEAETTEEGETEEETTEETQEEAKAEAEGDEVTIEVGMRLFVTSAKENGTVKAIDEDEGELTIKLDSGKKVIVGVDDLEAEKPVKKKGGMKLSK